MKENLIFVIQARIGSTRLPNKITIPFYSGKNVLELLLEKLKENFSETPIIVATTTNPQDDVIEKIAQANSVNVFRGSESNVLSRFVEAAHVLNKQHIIRICSDNPFLSIASLKELVGFLNSEANQDYDYVSFKVKDKPSIKTHYGFWTEYVKCSTLEKVSSMTDDSLYLEHVTNYIYEHPTSFKLHFLAVPKAVEEHDYLRLTMDTKADFDLLSNIYANMLALKQQKTIDITDVIKYVDSQGESIKKQMKEQIENNTK